jgi:2-methylcitrate dehydratase PrpD
MIHLARTHNLTPGRVERIEILPHARRLPHTNNPDPRTPLAAKFSVQYVVARALADRAVRLEHFEESAPFDPMVRELMGRMEARPHPDMPDNSPLQWGAEVVVTTRDGERLASRVDDFERRGPGGAPMGSDELWEKFEDCAGRSLPQDNIAPLFERLGRIETIGAIADLTVLLQQQETTARRMAR